MPVLCGDSLRLAGLARVDANVQFFRSQHEKFAIGLIYCENKRMIHDRAFELMETSMFAARYLRHIIGNQVVLSAESNGTVKARANYVVLQVLFDRPDATLHQVGVYYDVFRRVGGALKLAERRCVYDNLLVPNALCVPV